MPMVQLGPETDSSVITGKKGAVVVLTVQRIDNN